MANRASHHVGPKSPGIFPNLLDGEIPTFLCYFHQAPRAKFLLAVSKQRGCFLVGLVSQTKERPDTRVTGSRSQGQENRHTQAATVAQFAHHIIGSVDGQVPALHDAP
jgi:hypothetical protein